MKASKACYGTGKWPQATRSSEPTCVSANSRLCTESQSFLEHCSKDVIRDFESPKTCLL